MHFQIADPERLVAVDEFDLRHPRSFRGQGGKCAVRHPDGQAMSGRKLEGARHMIAVFMRDKDAGQIVRSQSEAGQPERNFTQAEPAIKENPRGARFDEKRVAAAAAAQRCKAHRYYFNWS